MAALDIHQLGCDLVERAVPVNRQPFAVDLFQRRTQAIRIVVQILQGVAFGADMAFAVRVVLVALDRQNLLALGFDHHTAHGFT